MDKPMISKILSGSYYSSLYRQQLSKRIKAGIRAKKDREVNKKIEKGSKKKHNYKATHS